MRKEGRYHEIDGVVLKDEERQENGDNELDF